MIVLVTRKQQEDDNYLAHHGIKGQKWGVRRFQNADGTLTAAGKRRYERTTSQEDFADVEPEYKKKHRMEVMAKYEHLKTDAQKKADQDRKQAWDNYQKYVEDYSKTHEDTQKYYEHDYDHTKKGKRLLAEFWNASANRELAYAGAEWYAKYAKEMERANEKDYRNYWR